jgi:hypothetical protein
VSACVRTCVRACLDDVEPDLGGFECVGRARPLRHRVQLALDLSPGADVAAVRPVPVQMWRTFSLRYSPSGRSCTYVHVQLPVGCLSSDHSCGFSTYLPHTKHQCVATEHRQRLFIAKRCTADLSRRASVRLQPALRVGGAPHQVLLRPNLVYRLSRPTNTIAAAAATCGGKLG